MNEYVKTFSNLNIIKCNKNSVDKNIHTVDVLSNYKLFFNITEKDIEFNNKNILSQRAENFYKETLNEINEKNKKIKTFKNIKNFHNNFASFLINKLNKSHSVRNNNNINVINLKNKGNEYFINNYKQFLNLSKKLKKNDKNINLIKNEFSLDNNLNNKLSLNKSLNNKIKNLTINTNDNAFFINNNNEKINFLFKNKIFNLNRNKIKLNKENFNEIRKNNSNKEIFINNNNNIFNKSKSTANIIIKDSFRNKTNNNNNNLNNNFNNNLNNNSISQNNNNKNYFMNISNFYKKNKEKKKQILLKKEKLKELLNEIKSFENSVNFNSNKDIIDKNNNYKLFIRNCYSNDQKNRKYYKKNSKFINIKSNLTKPKSSKNIFKPKNKNIIKIFNENKELENKNIQINNSDDNKNNNNNYIEKFFIKQQKNEMKNEVKNYINNLGQLIYNKDSKHAVQYKLVNLLKKGELYYKRSITYLKD